MSHHVPTSAGRARRRGVRGRAIPIATAASVAAMAAFAAGSSPVAAQEDPDGDALIGLVGDDTLIHFDASDPSTILSETTITGVADDESVVSIDGRPGTGQIVALAISDGEDSDTARLYVVDPDTGAAVPVGDVTIDDIDDDARTTVDFNPTVDRLRVIGAEGQSLRVNPNDGALVEEDARLEGLLPGSEVLAIAYDQNVVAFEPGGPTTLFAITSLGNLVQIGGVDGDPSPNEGEVSFVGPLGAVPDDEGVGFDISAADTAYASMTVVGVNGLYEVDTESGSADLIGTIGDGDLDVQSIAVRVGGFAEGASQFTRIDTPTRVVDTRATGKIDPDSAVNVQITGEAGVPEGATSVVLNVTVSEANEAGYTSVYPTGTDVPATGPDTSSVNVEDETQTRAALVTVPIGDDGQVTVYSDPGSHLLVDVAGYFAPVATGAGALTPVEPGRVLDTRSGLGVPDGSDARLAPASTTEVQVLGQAGVPDEGVGAVVVNLTAVEASEAGYVTAWGDGEEHPEASNLNVSAAGETIANLAIVPVSADGTIQLYTQNELHLLVDVTGWFGDDANALATPAGAFVPLQPERLLDSRIGGEPVAPDSVVDVQVGGPGDVPTDAAAVAGTVTITQSTAPGYVTAFPSGGELPEASNLNVFTEDATIANGIIVGLGEGALSLYTDGGGHLIADVSGYFQG